MPESARIKYVSMMDDDQIITEIRSVLIAHARMGDITDGLAADADLYESGMTSLARVDVMLGLEDAFDIEFPNRLLKHSVFNSITSIAGAIREIMAESPPPTDA